jgi:hypothetical protein
VRLKDREKWWWKREGWNTGRGKGVERRGRWRTKREKKEGVSGNKIIVSA